MGHASSLPGHRLTLRDLRWFRREPCPGDGDGKARREGVLDDERRDREVSL